MPNLLKILILLFFCTNVFAQPRNNYNQSNGSFCEAFNKIIESSYTNFNTIRGQTVKNDNGFWRNVYCVPSVNLPGAKDCRITENLFTSYDCTMGRWDSYSPLVLKEYENTVANIKKCLPENWEMKEEKNVNSSIIQFESFDKNGENTNTATKSRIIVRLFKISENTYQLTFNAFAPVTD